MSDVLSTLFTGTVPKLFVSNFDGVCQIVAENSSAGNGE